MTVAADAHRVAHTDQPVDESTDEDHGDQGQHDADTRQCPGPLTDRESDDHRYRSSNDTGHRGDHRHVALRECQVQTQHADAAGDATDDPPPHRRSGWAAGLDDRNGGEGHAQECEFGGERDDDGTPPPARSAADVVGDAVDEARAQSEQDRHDEGVALPPGSPHSAAPAFERHRVVTNDGNRQRDVRRQTSMKRSNVNRTMAALTAVGMVLAGCGGDDEDGGDTESEGTAEQRIFDEREDDADGGRSGRPDEEAYESADEDAGSGDAEGDLVEPRVGTTEATAEETGGRLDAPATEVAAGSSDAGGGLFGSDPPPPDADRQLGNTFEDYGYRDFVATADDPLSTFALDVDTGAYSVARRWLDDGSLPPRESVRPEEYVNAFEYDYDTPRRGLELSVDGGPSPFDGGRHLVRIGVQGEIVDDRDRGPAALDIRDRHVRVDGSRRPTRSGEGLPHHARRRTR